jgi:hypothetical protein
MREQIENLRRENSAACRTIKKKRRPKSAAKISEKKTTRGKSVRDGKFWKEKWKPGA